MRKRFDHKKTGFSLEGKHSKFAVTNAIWKKRTKRFVRPMTFLISAKTTTCASCHKKDDPHYFKGSFAKKDCNACHGVRTWEKTI